MGRVIAVGSINVDLVVRTSRLPGPGETVAGDDLARHHGGKGGNQAVAAARAGAAVWMVGAVGQDELADSALAALAADGVDTGEVVRAARPTGVALIVVDGKGQNQIAVAAGANGALGGEAVTAALARLGPLAGDVVLVSCELPRPAVEAALRGGRDGGATTLLNPAPADGVDGALAALADVLTPNQAELAILSPPGDPDEAARRLLGPRRTRWLVVTLGAAGALLLGADGERQAVPAPAVEPIDTTGAGDTFNGVLAALLAAGEPMREAVERAVLAASHSTTRAGARDGMPTLDELARIR